MARNPAGNGSTALARWHALAVGSLLCAGVLALLLVVGRVPPLSSLDLDPLFFKRCLVVHVDLALVVWLLAFTAGLVTLAGTRGALARRAPYLGALGAGLMLLAATAKGAKPVLSNYVPMIDHPLFATGLVVFAAGILLTIAGSNLLGPSPDDPLVPPAAATALRAAAVALLFALLTFGASFLSTPNDLPLEAFYEALFWGGGHVLQFASTAAMLGVWIILVTAIVGRSPIAPRAASWLFGLFVLPLFGAPVLAMRGTVLAGYRDGFTWLMELAIFPGVLVVLALLLREVRRARREGRIDRAIWRDVRWTGFLASAGLALTGFVLGALIRGSNTVVPAHYHASIGAVTAAFMTVTYVLLPRLDLAMPTGRTGALARFQPLVFGAGQALFALGFALAGEEGMARKVYGPEQHVRTPAEYLGLSLMGLGGLVAAAGGLFFLGLMIAAWRERARRRSQRSLPCPIPSVESIPSKG